MRYVDSTDDTENEGDHGGELGDLDNAAAAGVCCRSLCENLMSVNY